MKDLKNQAHLKYRSASSYSHFTEVKQEAALQKYSREGGRDSWAIVSA
jgi:hypothetical protein